MTTKESCQTSDLSLRPLTRQIGADAGAFDLARIAAADCDGGIIQEIEQALKTHGVLLFRDQHLDPATLVGLARRFGEIYVTDNPKKNKLVGGFPEIYVVSNLKNEAGKSIGGLGAGEAVWHSDISYLRSPPKASFLYALEIPQSGGDTSVCSMAAALANMPADLRRQIASRSIKHDATYNAGGLLRHGVKQSDDPRAADGTLHPAICQDPETGQAFLYLGRRRNSYIDGLEPDASDALLDELWEHATREDHVYRHKWQTGDLLMWDNRMTMHRREAFDADARRLMHHVRLKGTTPPLAASAQ